MNNLSPLQSDDYLLNLPKEDLLSMIRQLHHHVQNNELHFRTDKADIGNKELIELLEANSHDLLLVHDLEGNIIGYNRAADEFIAPNVNNIKEFLVPEFRVEFEKYLNRVLTNGFDKGFMRVYDKIGEVRLLNYSNKLVVNSLNEKIVHCIGHDITELWTTNKKLRLSETSYRGLFDFSNDAILILSKKGEIIDLNQTALQFYGVKKEEVYKKDFSYLNTQKYLFNDTISENISSILSDVWDTGVKVFEWQFEDENNVRFVHEIIFRKGQYFEEEVIIAYDRDISERKLQEERKLKQISVEESQKRLQETFEKVRMVAVSVDENCNVTYCNTNFLNITGLKKNEVLGKDLFDFFVPEPNTENQRSDLLAMAEGNSILDQFERQMVSKYRDLRMLQFNVVMIPDADGLIRGFSLVGKDVTENKRVVRALRETNKKLEDFMQNANDLIQFFTLSGKISYVNYAWKKTLGYTDEDLENLSFNDIIAADYKDSTAINLKAIMDGKEINDFETVLKTKDGKIVYVTCSANFKNISGIEPEFRAIFHNNTLRIRAERTQRLIYAIANLANKTENLQNLYVDIHKILKQYIDVNNFHVALFDKNYADLKFPYYVDENYPGIVNTNFRVMGKGLTEYTLNQGKAVFLFEEDILELQEKNEIILQGQLPKIWMGVPLRLENKIIGAIAVKSYSDKTKYKLRHLEMLDFVSGQIALAIDRKIKDEKIANQTSRLTAIIESSSHLIWSVNQRFELTSFNQNYAEAIFKIHGIQITTENAKNESRLFLSDDVFKEAIEQKYTLAFKGEPQHYETYTTDKQTGNKLWRETYLNPIISAQNTIEEVSGISHDITEKKNAELAIQRSEQLFRNIFESFQDIYYQTDFDGRITLISPSVYELTGYTPEEMIGKRISDYYVNSKKQERSLKQLLRTGKVRNFEVSIRRKDGTEIQTISNIRVVFNNNREAIATEGVARDITSLKKTELDLIAAKELAEKSLKVKELFLANMSHEIRTPMNGVIGMIDLLDDTQLNTVQKDYVGTIKRSSETLLTILNDILDLSKIEAGKMQLKPQPVFLDNVLEKLYSLFAQQAKNKSINFSYSLEDDLPRFVLADETRLLQIFSNLTSNAIKFTEVGGVAIRLEKVKTNKQSVVIKASISDSGIGISKDNLPLLFNTFSQVDNSSTKAFGGTGLGLVISKQLCELMNGTMGVKSKMSEGSVFWFTFELPIIAPFEVVQTKTNTTENVKFINTSVLVVDDNAVNRKVATEILLKHGCKVETATNGIEAIEKVKNNNYSLVLMDIQMPVMDGVTAMKEIKATVLKPLPPIVAMTAYSMKEDKQKYLDTGMDDYIAKPIRPDALVEKLCDWLVDSFTNVQAENTFVVEAAAPQNDFIDFEVINQLKKYGGKEVIVEMWQDFAAEAVDLMKDANELLQKHEFVLLKSPIHTIKGSAGTVGLRNIAHLATIIDKKLKENQLEGIFTDMEELNHVYDYFVQFMQAGDFEFIN